MTGCLIYRYAKLVAMTEAMLPFRVPDRRSRKDGWNAISGKTRHCSTEKGSTEKVVIPRQVNTDPTRQPGSPLRWAVTAVGLLSAFQLVEIVLVCLASYGIMQCS